MNTLDKALVSVNHHRRSAQVWHVFSGISHFYLHIPTGSSAIRMNIPAFVFPAIAGSHLPTRRDGRLSRSWCEVARVYYIPYQALIQTQRRDYMLYAILVCM